MEKRSVIAHWLLLTGGLSSQGALQPYTSDPYSPLSVSHLLASPQGEHYTNVNEKRATEGVTVVIQAKGWGAHGVLSVLYILAVTLVAAAGSAAVIWG